MVTKIEVDIRDIETDDRHYSFRYKIWRNGELKHEGMCNGNHSWLDEHLKFKESLELGYAAKLALENAL